MLKDRDQWVRRGAAQALGRIGDVEAIEPLIVVLKDTKVDASAAAASALGEIGDVRAVQALIDTLGDQMNHLLHEAAAKR